jgi:hypothetical protein
MTLNKYNIMWHTDTLWFEIGIVSIFYLFGNIYFGHFEERSPKWKKVVKYLVTVLIICLLSVYFGRGIAFTFLGLALLPVIYVHGILLPRKGINGWTGEPKSRYYDFRGWDKNIFGNKEGTDKQDGAVNSNLLS